MPTGYTAKLYEGEAQTFNEFVLSCAHAFGALITLRDSGMDSPIPEFKPSDYHKKALADARSSLAELEAMTDQEASERSHADYQKAVSAQREAKRSRGEMEARYRAMLAQVEEWVPPTADHDDLKKFMREQLEDSIRHDCGMDYWPEPRHAPGPVWLQEQIDRANRDIGYHADEWEKEVERTEGRNAWVRALRASLGGEDNGGDSA